MRASDKLDPCPGHGLLPSISGRHTACVPPVTAKQARFAEAHKAHALDGWAKKGQGNETHTVFASVCTPGSVASREPRNRRRTSSHGRA